MSGWIRHGREPEELPREGGRDPTINSFGRPGPSNEERARLGEGENRPEPRVQAGLRESIRSRKPRTSFLRGW